MLENFIYAKEKSLFEEKLNNGEVLDEAIAFIEDTKEIWTHGSYFSNLDDVLKITEQSLTEEQKAQVKANLGIVESKGIEDAPADGNLYARKNKAWELLNNSDPNMFQPLEEIGLILNNKSVTEEQYNKILSFHDENKISNGDNEASYASFWLNGMFCIAEISQTEEENVNIRTSSVINNGPGIFFTDFTIQSDHSFVLNYSENNLIGGDSAGLFIQAGSFEHGVTEITIETHGDGTKFLSNSGEYKEIESGISDAPSDGNLYARKDKAWEILNNSKSEKFPILEEIAPIFENKTATEDQYNKILSFYLENKIPNGDYEAAYASFLLEGEFHLAKIDVDDEYIHVYASNVLTGNTDIKSFDFALSEDLSLRFNYFNRYGIENVENDFLIRAISYSGYSDMYLLKNGDGTKFLSDTGEYKEIESGIPDARKDGNLYGRILGNWGVIKQDTLNAYDVSSDGQIFNFTKNLEKGIVQYAEIYNPLGTEVTVYIKRDTDTRQVEVKMAPGSTVLFRIISGIKGFYLEKVYYSSL